MRLIILMGLLGLTACATTKPVTEVCASYSGITSFYRCETNEVISYTNGYTMQNWPKSAPQVNPAPAPSPSPSAVPRAKIKK